MLLSRQGALLATHDFSEDREHLLDQGPQLEEQATGNACGES